MIDCPRCGTKFAQLSTHCASCGYEASGSAVPSNDHLIIRFFKTVRQILLEPADFFRRLPARGGFAEPLAFALICHWIGKAISFLWISMSADLLKGYFDKFAQLGDQLKDIDSSGRYAQWTDTGSHWVAWFWGAGSVMVDPFFTLTMIFVTSFFIWLGARLLVTPGKNGAPSEITFESALRINCYGMAPAILASLPLLGGVVSTIWMWVATIIAAKYVYRIGTTRATFVALFTHVIITAIMLVGLALISVLLFRLLYHS